MARIPRGIIFL